MRVAPYIAATLVLAAPAHGALDERCTITVLNQAVQANPDGTFALPGVSVDGRLHRIRATCPRENGATEKGQSDYIRMRRRRTVVPRVDLRQEAPSPLAVLVSAPRTTLDAAASTVALAVTCRLPGDRTTSCTREVDGTSYTASNPAVCTVSADGVVTGVASGGCAITAVNQGVVGAIVLVVTLGADADGDGMPDDFERRHACLALGAPDAAGDPDGDGLTSAQELAFGSDPCAADGDGDGLTDQAEALGGTSPLLADTDGDGALDGAEVTAGTNPRVADSDGDGLGDGFELRAGCVSARNPDTDADGVPDLEEDCDADGLTNEQERDLFLEPGTVDTDGDGLRDGFEVGAGFDPGTPGEEHQDADGDGLDNLGEQQKGGDPRVSDTDGDGLTDGDEVNRHGTSPARADTDGDGLRDPRELELRTDPTKADTDGGGRSDGQEVNVDGTNPLDPTDDKGVGGIVLSDTPARRDGEPMPAVDADGNVHVVWLDARGPEPQVFYTMLSPTGATLIDDTALSTPDEDAEAPALAVDPDRHVHVVWLGDMTLDATLVHTVLDPARAPRDGSPTTLEAISVVAPHAVSSRRNIFGVRPQVAVDRQRRVHIVWSDPNDERVLYTQLAAEGRVVVERPLSAVPGTTDLGIDGTLQPRLAVDRNDDVHVVWSARLATQTAEVFYTMLDGRTGATRIDVSRVSVSDSLAGPFPSVGVLPSGEIAVLHLEPRQRADRVIGDLVLNLFAPTRHPQDGRPSIVDALRTQDETTVDFSVGGRRIRVTNLVAAVDAAGDLRVTFLDGSEDDAYFLIAGTDGQAILPTQFLPRQFNDDLFVNLAVAGPTTYLTSSDRSFVPGAERQVLRILRPDADHDGLADADEILGGTSPTDADSDDDGLADGFEVANGFDPRAAGEQSEDPDGDGLDNLGEQAARSDPRRADTDGDGIPDGAERATGSDPAHPDTDRDRLSDADERTRGTSPTDPDTDGDGLLDGFEVANGFDPLAGGDGGQDPDGDGLDNRAEQDLNSNPRQADVDGDGLLDGAERTLGTNPNNPDTDGDGLSDGVEARLVPCVSPLDPVTDRRNLVGDALRDCDGDALPNAREVDLGTDPQDADSDDDGASDAFEVNLGCNPLAPELTTVVGRVLDAQSNPVAGADVGRVANPALATQTNAAGTFTLAGASGCGELLMLVTATQGGDLVRGVSRPLTPVLGGTTDAGDIVVRKIPRFLYPEPRFPLADAPAGIATGDVNRDGIPDVVTQIDGAGLSVRLGTGDGSFEPEILRSDRRQFGQSLRLADLTGDGNLDAIVPGGSGVTDVSVLIGNGDGSFKPRTVLGGFQATEDARAADFDRDGVLDLAIADSVAPGVSVLLGNGDGTFESPKTFAVSGFTAALAPLDVDRDGTIDLVVANGASPLLDLFTGVGDGTFEAGPGIDLGFLPTQLEVADMNADTVPDLVALNPTNLTGRILLGQPGGGLTLAGSFTIPALPGAFSPFTRMTVVDANGDGTLDVLVPNRFFDDVSVFLGNRDGTVQAERRVAGGFGALGVVAADFDRDGIIDLVTANQESKDLSLLQGRGDGTFVGPLRADLGAFPFGSFPQDLLVSDLDGNGTLDAVAASLNRNVVVLQGQGDGTFSVTQPINLTPRGGGEVVGADFDGDRVQDLIVPSEFFGELSLLSGKGDGTFQPERVVTTARLLRNVAVGDVNADGAQDLVALTTIPFPVSLSLGLFLGNGDGTFGSEIPLAGVTATLVLGDLDNDGKLDVVFADNSSLPIGVLFGDGAGAFSSVTRFGLGQNVFPRALTLADVNRDGLRDIVTVGGAGDVLVLVARGNRTFAPQPVATPGVPGDTVAAADVDVDGQVDVVIASFQRLAVLPGNGDGTFRAPELFGAQSNPAGLNVIDVDRDGLEDVAVVATPSSGNAGALSVLLHR